ncbi:MAG: NAD(P)-dependent oxidoreductase [Planctomycetota bacterium]
MVLITGIPGFLGNRLAEVLVNGLEGYPDSWPYARTEEIRCLCLPAADASSISRLSNRIEVARGDVVDKKSMTEFFKDSEGATLFHLAGVIHPDKKMGGGVKQFYRVNVDGTKNVLDLAKEHRVKKVIVISSDSQSGFNPNKEHRFTEDSPYNPYMNYGRSKMLMEQIVNGYVNLDDMDITIIRTCWLYGPNQPERHTEFFTMIKEGKVPMIGDGTNLCSMSYVDNTCSGMLLASINSATKGKTYWIADERPYSMNEIIDTIADVLENDFGFKVNHRRIRLPNLVGSIAYLIDSMLQGMGFYNKKIHVLSEMNKNSACSIELARKEIGYNPVLSLREGMNKSIKWCINNNHRI